MLFNPVIINGFDRSGTSAITRVLANHPLVTLIMQPFNSGVLRDKMYEEFQATTDNEVYKLLEGFVAGEIREEYIHSHWYYEYSSSKEFEANKLHIIKTTINHFAQKWMMENFKSIDVWGIWRNPMDIVSSIINNGFYSMWYEDAIEKITPTVYKVGLLNCFSDFLKELDTDIKKTAFLLSVRSYYFFYYMKGERIIEYEKFNEDPNYLNAFYSHYGLYEIDLSPYSKMDLNIIGSRNNKEFEVSESELDFMDRIFEPLIELKNNRINDKIS